MFQQAVIDPRALIFTQTSQLHKSNQKHATGAAAVSVFNQLQPAAVITVYHTDTRDEGKGPVPAEAGHVL